jgi:hypothetical protein
VSVLGINTKLCDPTHVMSSVGPSSGKDIADHVVVNPDLDICGACGWWDTLRPESCWSHAYASALFSEGTHVLLSDRIPDAVVFEEEFGSTLEHVVGKVLTFVLVKCSHSCCESIVGP